MTATSTSAARTPRTVREEIEAFEHRWDHYFVPPYEVKFWPGLVKMDWVSQRLVRVSRAILINVLPAVIPLQVLIYFDVVDWTNLALDALLVLEIGPCRILTRLLNRVAPYPREEISP